MLMANIGETTFLPEKPRRPKGAKQRKERKLKYTLYFEQHGGKVDKIGDYPTLQSIADELSVSDVTVFKLLHGYSKRPWKLARYTVVPYQGSDELKSFFSEE
ncbi:hypothetical protein HDV00_011920 [Rhizophlyctis rosea]|nr:hypothetical protein HDV00_011920 [Rhizophlyctis rosea]